MRRRLKIHSSMIAFALVAMFALALGPSVSRLLPQDETARLMALAFCGGDAGHALSLMRGASQGPMSLSRAGEGVPARAGDVNGPDGREDSGRGDAGLLGLDCPLCSIAGGHLLAPAAFPVPDAPRLIEGPPERFFTSARPLFAWAAVRSRGPPTRA